jgi:hypothetical protein
LFRTPHRTPALSSQNLFISISHFGERESNSPFCICVSRLLVIVFLITPLAYSEPNGKATKNKTKQNKTKQNKTKQNKDASHEEF